MPFILTRCRGSLLSRDRNEGPVACHPLTGTFRRNRAPPVISGRFSSRTSGWDLAFDRCCAVISALGLNHIVYSLSCGGGRSPFDRSAPMLYAASSLLSPP